MKYKYNVDVINIPSSMELEGELTEDQLKEYHELNKKYEGEDLKRERLMILVNVGKPSYVGSVMMDIESGMLGLPVFKRIDN